jgi:hypothetical protein
MYIEANSAFQLFCVGVIGPKCLFFSFFSLIVSRDATTFTLPIVKPHAERDASAVAASFTTAG